MIEIMVRKNYSDEFRRQSVELYESTPGASLRSIAEDLGLSRHTLSDWVRQHGTGRRTPPLTTGAVAARAESDGEKMARLEAENARLRAEKRTVETEREILQKAAKYFAGETTW